ncbi:MAG: hypothetical protein RIS51_277 [Actinomycetota bacterium]|jgi:uncharacterized protein
MRSKCSHCTKVSVGRELGISDLRDLLDQFYEKPDNLAIRYGMKFEAELESQLIGNLGNQIQAPAQSTMEATLDLMNQGVPVIYQGVIKGGTGAIDFSGRPDFLLRSDYRFEFGPSGLTTVQVDGWVSGYSAWDAKLSSTAKPEYQNQVGLYCDALKELELLGKSNSGLLLGNRTVAEFSSDVLIAQMIEQRNPFVKLVEDLIDKSPQRAEDLGELICEASSYCETCEYPLLCDDQRRKLSHLQLVFNITRPQIESLQRSGIRTVSELAAFEGQTDKLSEAVVSRLRKQASLQLKTYETGHHFYELLDASPIRELPKPSDADIYFDMEGFAFYQGGLEYLFGWVVGNQNPRFEYEWADDREAEKIAFENFVKRMVSHLERFPDSNIYHYAHYEQTALARLAERHGTCKQEVAELIESGRMIDLFKVVKSALLLSQESYSIKKLENYYPLKRVSQVKEAVGSMDFYDKYRDALATNSAEAEMLKRQVLDYNQDDCLSTLALLQWLRSLT